MTKTNELNFLFFKITEALNRQGIIVVLPYTFVDGAIFRISDVVANIRAIATGAEDL